MSRNPSSTSPNTASSSTLTGCGRVTPFAITVEPAATGYRLVRSSFKARDTAINASEQRTAAHSLNRRNARVSRPHFASCHSTRCAVVTIFRPRSLGNAQKPDEAKEW